MFSDISIGTADKLAWFTEIAAIQFGIVIPSNNITRHIAPSAFGVTSTNQVIQIFAKTLPLVQIPRSTKTAYLVLVPTRTAVLPVMVRVTRQPGANQRENTETSKNPHEAGSANIQSKIDA